MSTELQPYLAADAVLPTNVNVLKQMKAAAKDRAEDINLAAMQAGRDLNAEEAKEFASLMRVAKRCGTAIEANERDFGSFKGGRNRGPQRPTNPLNIVRPGSRDLPHEQAEGISGFPGVADFIMTGEGGEKTALSEGGNLQYTVPGWQVEQFVAAYPTNAPFVEAGSTIFETEDAHQINVPIVSTGDDPATYSEGTGPTVAQDANVYIAKLGAHKRAFLTKISEEAAQDIGTLESTVVTEGIRRVMRIVSNAATDALVTSLTAAGALSYPGIDHLGTLLNAEAAIDVTWASMTNCWMMDLSSLATYRNTRDLQDRPIFDPTAKTLLGYKVVINQRLRGRVLFGAFKPAVYIRQTPMAVQRLIELYTESGQIGIRFQRRADQAFFSDAATASQAPQPVILLTETAGS
jgi:HK97 family phage major capsid protein